MTVVEIAGSVVRTIGIAVGTVAATVGLGVTAAGTPRASTGKSAPSHRAAIFFSPDVTGCTPPS